VALDRRLREWGVRACAVHPGGIQTELGRHLTPETLQLLMQRYPMREPPRFKSVPQGAATTVWAAVVADAADIGGRYCEDCGGAQLTDDPNATSGVRAYALDPHHAEALWARSEELVGEQFALT
jgi:NAD(P)-dependent dehydrogenase (short-subunit alcohol dehydrogenase family)